jgi:hypothetical protein
LGNEEKPKYVLINAILPSIFQEFFKKKLMKFKDVFAWIYNGLKGIPR